MTGKNEADKLGKAIYDIVVESDDIELIKGFLVSTGSSLAFDGEVIQLYGILIEVLYDMRLEDVKKAVKRMLDDDGEPAIRRSAEFARMCSLKYKSTFQ